MRTSKLGLRAAGNYTSLQKFSLQELRKPQLQPTAAVAVANVVKPQAPQQQPTAAVAVDDEVEPQEVAAARKKELLCRTRTARGLALNQSRMSAKHALENIYQRGRLPATEAVSRSSGNLPKKPAQSALHSSWPGGLTRVLQRD